MYPEILPIPLVQYSSIVESTRTTGVDRNATLKIVLQNANSSETDTCLG